MSCMLRVFGSSLKIDELLSQLTLIPNSTWHIGEQHHGVTLKESGASFVVSEADMSEFNCQTKEACTFLNKNTVEIQSMVKFTGVKEVILDFGIELRDTAIHSDYLSPSFIEAVAHTGVGVELSHYPCKEENES